MILEFLPFIIFLFLLCVIILFQGPSYEETLKIRKDNLSPALFTFYKKPLLLHQGHMQWLFDHTGRRYLDLFGGIVTVSVGHCHPWEPIKFVMNKMQIDV